MNGGFMPAETHVSGKATTTKAHPHKVPPGPRVNPLSFLSSLLFGSPPDLLGIYTSAARDFGDVVRFSGGPLTSYFFNHPDHIKHVLLDNNHNYSKQHRVTDLLKPFVGDGLLTSDGEVWRRLRNSTGSISFLAIPSNRIQFLPCAHDMDDDDVAPNACH